MQRYLKTLQVQLPTRLTLRLTSYVILYRESMRLLKKLHNIPRILNKLPTSWLRHLSIRRKRLRVHRQRLMKLHNQLTTYLPMLPNQQR
ncbi:MULTISPECIES: hypothetical protein [Acinetobacter]|uniref:hypothetical protein n=1 Tax=Acinetobacter sp. TaxID=472 RepID=UPI003307B79E